MGFLDTTRKLFTSDPDEVRILNEVAFPPVYDVGRRVVALGIAGLGVVLTLLFDDGNDLLTISLIVLSVVPWVLEVAGVVGLSLRLRLVMMLTPSALVTVATVAGVIGTEDGAAPFGAHVTLLVLLVLAAECFSATRADAAIVLGATTVVVMSRLLLTDELANTLFWGVALSFTVVAVLGLRFGCMAMTRTKEALAQQAMTEERRRIARDIHDVVAHTLAVTMLHITAARMALRRQAPDDALEALEEAEQHGRSSLADVRRIVRLLRIEDGTALELFAQPDLGSLPDLVAGYRAAGLPVELDVIGDISTVAPGAGLALYRVVQEALANAARHGDGPASVNVRIVDGLVVVSVCNPRRGDAAVRPHQGRGSGLVGMRERMLAAGGSFDAGPTDVGWAVRANVPVTGPPGGSGPEWTRIAAGAGAGVGTSGGNGRPAEAAVG